MTHGQKIDIFDTTLRDGQQSPGAGMSFEDNLVYATYADNLKIDILEAGFPAASQYDFSIVEEISKQMAAKKSAMKVAALCQLREDQVTRTMESLRASCLINKARVHTYVPVDPNLMQASLGRRAKNKQQIIAEVYRLIKMATSEGYEVEFSPEGYSRMQNNFDFTTDVIRAAVSAGAAIINCPDTIGGASRWQQEDYFAVNMQKHAEIIEQEFPHKEIIWSVHCHNDFGLALDNTMTAVFSGPARQIEGCINGVGERAGNVALEQCIMIIDQFGEQKDFYTDINISELKNISDFIAEKMLARQPHFPIIGENSARHSSGGHTNAIIKNPLAYQPFDPRCVGSEISFVFGPLSGSNHAKNILNQQGYYCPEEEKAQVAQSIKNMYSERRKGITDEELVAGYERYRAPIQAEEITYSKDKAGHTILQIKGTVFGGDGCVVYCDGENSALSALHEEVKKHFPKITIVDYHSNSCDGLGIDAKCQSTIIVSTCKLENYIGKAIDADICISSIKAYINAVNQAYVNLNYRVQEQAYA